MKIHLVGMGLLGSLTAWQLFHNGFGFTWEDNDSKITAYKACTGACYPSGGQLNTNCYEQWKSWIAEGVYPGGCLEECAYWADNNTRSLPHGLIGTVMARTKHMRLIGTSVHLDAQRFVSETRKTFTDSRRYEQPLNSLRVVSHGFSKCERVIWGWTRLVRLQISEEVLEHGRPSFYLRQNRFQFAYCYPRPNTDWWYAGSSLISQRQPHSLRVTPKYNAWKERFLRLSGGAVSISEEGRMIEGWRPAKSGSLSTKEGYAASVPDKICVEGDEICYPSLASNGFRHFPSVWWQLKEHLGAK